MIDAGRCVQCGVCVAACPSDSIGIGADDLPKLVKMCTGCSLCWDFCPRGGLRYEALGEVMQEAEWKLDGGLNGKSNGHGNGAHTSAGWRSSQRRSLNGRHPQPLSRRAGRGEIGWRRVAVLERVSTSTLTSPNP